MIVSTIFLVLLVSTCTQQQQQTPDRLSEIVTFVADVVAKLNTEQTGIVDCWFYTSADNPQPDGILELILHQPALRHVPRVTFSQRLPEDERRTPALLVMDMRAYHREPIPAEFYPELLNVGMFVKALVLVSPETMDDLLKVVRPFFAAKWHYIFFICTNSNINFHMNSIYKMLFAFEGFPTSLQAVFRDYLQDVHGYQITVSHQRSNCNAAFSNISTSVGPAIDWLKVTAKHINATFSITRVAQCSNFKDCWMKRFLIDEKQGFDLSIDSEFMFPYSESLLNSVVPFIFGVIAPRGRRLEIHELFLEPFDKEVWIVVLILLMGCFLINRLFPNQFHNELILLVVCSFERTVLNRVGKVEKLIAISLLMFFFVLLSAYESLFMALLTSVPREHNPRTLNDLSTNEIKITIPLALTGEIFEELKFLILNISDISGDDLDGRYAYCDIYSHLEMVMKHPKNYDYEFDQSRYVMLEDPIWMGPNFYKFGFRNALIEKFRYTQSVLEESGTFRRFTDQTEHAYFGIRIHQVRIHNRHGSGGSLYAAQLKPAWISLVFGLTFSTTAWLAELVWFVLSKLSKPKIRTIRRFISDLKRFVRAIKRKLFPECQ